MGQTLTAWTAKVSAILMDTDNVDASTDVVQEQGIRPAIARYSTDRPRHVVYDVAGNGTGYYTLPGDWADGFSQLRQVEWPAYSIPPDICDDQQVVVAASTSSTATNQFVFVWGDRPSTTETVRFAYTAPWPFPTSTASTDKIDAVAYEAVAQLAAAYVCRSEATRAAQHRNPGMPSDFASGDRAELLRDAAAQHEAIYSAFVGHAGKADSGPVSIRVDFDPSRGSLWHGARR